MEARNRTLPDWFTQIRSGQLRLPRFQRFEAWSYGQITGLLDTVLRQLPAGSVLILEVGDREKFHSRPMEGVNETNARVTEHLLDGQQRLTALWRVLNDDYSDRSFFVRLAEDEETGTPFRAESFGRWDRNGKRYPVWLDDPTKVWAEGLIPVALLRPDQEAQQGLKEWSELAANGDVEARMAIIEKANDLRLLFAKFNVPFLSLPSNTQEDVALDVFIQMNTSATPLSAYDIVVAQVEAGTGQSLHELTDELRSLVPAIEDYVRAPDLLLQVSALLQDRSANKSSFLAKDFSSRMIDNWDEARRGIQRGIQFLQMERVFDGQRLPTDVALYPLCALWARAPEGLDGEGDARILLRKFLWRAFCTDRYERASATRALADYRSLAANLGGRRDDRPQIFDDSMHPLPEPEELVNAGWPVRRDRAARCLLAIAMRIGAADFADGGLASRDSLKKREYHHLFPRAWLHDRGYSETQINRSLNCALVTWQTNRTIGAKEPEEYLKARMTASSLGEPEVLRRLQSHLIPTEEILNNDYDEFLKARAILMHERMMELCSGQEG